MPGRYPVGDDELQVLEALTEAVYIIEADGRIQFCNAALAQLTGSPAETLLGRPSLDLYAPEDQPAVLDRRTRAFRGRTGAILARGHPPAPRRRAPARRALLVQSQA